MNRAQLGPLLALLLVATSCQSDSSLFREIRPQEGGFNPGRRIVPASSFEYAEKTNLDISQSLPANQALQVMRDLGRISEETFTQYVDERTGALLQPGGLNAVRVNTRVDGEENSGEDKISLSMLKFVPSGTASAVTPQDDDEEGAGNDDAEKGAEDPGGAGDEEAEPEEGEPQEGAEDTATGTAAGGQVMSQLLPTRLQPEIRKAGFYFSTVTAVAIEDGLNPTAIPALILGYRPQWGGGNVICRHLESWGAGIDLMVGGTLNSLSGGDDSGEDIELALGLGLTIPWSDAGALSFGVTTWRTEVDDPGGMGSIDDTEVAAYIGISLGSFNVADSSN